MSQLAQVAAASDNTVLLGLIGLVGSAIAIIGGIVTWLIKEMVTAMRSMANDLRENTKETRHVAHRFRGLESSLAMEVASRSTVTPFLRESLEKKIRRLEAEGEDSYGERS